MATQVGDLGMAPGANLSENIAVFDPLRHLHVRLPGLDRSCKSNPNRSEANH